MADSNSDRIYVRYDSTYGACMLVGDIVVSTYDSCQIEHFGVCYSLSVNTDQSAAILRAQSEEGPSLGDMYVSSHAWEEVKW